VSPRVRRSLSKLLSIWVVGICMRHDLLMGLFLSSLGRILLQIAGGHLWLKAEVRIPIAMSVLHLGAFVLEPDLHLTRSETDEIADAVARLLVGQRRDGKLPFEHRQLLGRLHLPLTLASLLAIVLAVAVATASLTRVGDVAKSCECADLVPLLVRRHRAVERNSGLYLRMVVNHVLLVLLVMLLVMLLVNTRRNQVSMRRKSPSGQVGEAFIGVGMRSKLRIVMWLWLMLVLLLLLLLLLLNSGGLEGCCVGPRLRLKHHHVSVWREMLLRRILRLHVQARVVMPGVGTHQVVLGRLVGVELVGIQLRRQVSAWNGRRPREGRLGGVVQSAR